MLFNSLAFLVFITIVLVIYPRLCLRKQNLFLLFFSYFFYGYWDWRFTPLLLVSTLNHFFAGKYIYLTADKNTRKWLLIVSVSTSLGILAFFKYFNFFIDSTCALLSFFGFDPHLPVLRILLPIGISFYTFHPMTYTIDIYNGKLKPTDSFVDFALFVSFFPQLVAGPIVRAKDLLPQIFQPRQVGQADIFAGINLILLGFFKKVAISDSLSPIVESIFSSPVDMNSGQLLTGVYAFSLQIYGDFSGYTDIARGISLLMGFRLIENFDAPYLSRNVTEFWRRWHISLSTWLRDYLYIPLGGNRHGTWSRYRNLMVTMFLGGLWHGAAWTFVAWGALHGLYLSIHHMLLKGRRPDFSWPSKLSDWPAVAIKIFLTFHLVALTWIFFRAPDFHNALLYFKGLFQLNQIFDLSMPVLFAGALVIFLDLIQTWSGSHTWLTDQRAFSIARYTTAQLMLFSVIIASIAHIETVTPFIYFQF